MHLSRFLKPAAALVVLAVDFLIVAPTAGAFFPRHFIVSPGWIGAGLFALFIVGCLAIWFAFNIVWELISRLRKINRPKLTDGVSTPAEVR